MKQRHSYARRIAAVVVSVALAWPGTAFADVLVDGTELIEGANSVGGGTATYGSGSLGMENVTANNVSTNEDLNVNFSGGNSVDKFQVTGDANVDVSFEGSNNVEDIEAYDSSNVTVNLNGHNETEDIEASDNSTLTVNVTGENEVESVKGYDDADVTVQGTNCPRKDVVKVGDDESSERIGTERGNLVVKDVTVVTETEQDQVRSTGGNVSILCSKIAGGDDNKRTDITAAGTLFVGGSVIDVKGTMSSGGKMTIRRSDVDVARPDGDDSPYRVWSKTGIDIIEERNGEVKKGKLGDDEVWYLKTDDDDASEKVHLVSALKPCYYGKCANTGDDDDDEEQRKWLPATADESVSVLPVVILGGLFVALDIRRRLMA